MSQNGNQVQVNQNSVSIHFKELFLFTYIKNSGYLNLPLELKRFDQTIPSNASIVKMENVELTRASSNQYIINRLDKNKDWSIEFFNNNEFKTINI